MNLCKASYEAYLQEVLRSQTFPTYKVYFHVIVSYGVSISTVADNLIENVKYKVSEFTGLEIKKINIYVEGVRVID